MKLLVGFLFVVGGSFFCAESLLYSKVLRLKENVFDVHLYVNATEQRFYFKVVANTTGWVALAFTTYEGAEDMINYDIVLGGVRNGNQSYLNDYWSESEIRPTLDATQDVLLTSATETNGQTTLEFNRKAETGDNQQDTPFKMNNVIFLAWAIGREDATNATMFEQHPDKAGGGRGHTKVGYNMYNFQVVQPITPTQTGSVVVPSFVALIVIQLAIQMIN